MLIEYLKQNYMIVPFSEIPKEDTPYLVLRHDVDLSLVAALKMAKTEHKIGIRSSYFILLSSNNYNCFNGESISIIRQICELGHEIGLHYDTRQYKCYAHNDIYGLKLELQVLESIIGRKVHSISSHAPKGPNSFLELSGYVNADNSKSRDIYVHDSRKLWTAVSLSILLSNSKKRPQLLIHPCHWEGKTDPRTKLRRFLVEEPFQSLLWLLYKVRTLFIRILSTHESCEN
jgi:hypothetical protein